MPNLLLKLSSGEILAGSPGNFFCFFSLFFTLLTVRKSPMTSAPSTFLLVIVVLPQWAQGSSLLFAALSLFLKHTVFSLSLLLWSNLNTSSSEKCLWLFKCWANRTCKDRACLSSLQFSPMQMDLRPSPECCSHNISLPWDPHIEEAPVGET